MGYRASAQHTVSIGEVADGLLKRVVVGQNKAAERLLALSAAEVPLGDTGELLASGHVDPATDTDEAADVVYDDVKAARWHEDGPLVDSLGRRYPGNSNFRNGRKSHYLSDPAQQNKDELVNIIRKEAGGA